MTRSVAFALLASLLIVGQVSAGCAWVLWFEDSSVIGWNPVGAYPTSSACDTQLDKQISALKGMAGVQREGNGTSRTTVEVDGHTVTMKVYSTFFSADGRKTDI